MARVEMVPLVTATSSFEAKVLTARLGAAGIVWELRGSLDGLYPVGHATVLVPSAELEVARELLLADAVEAALTTVDSRDDGAVTDPAGGARRSALRTIGALTVLAAMAAVVIARLSALA